MKKQTGDDYGLFLSKKFVNPKFWADTNAILKRPDNWDDHPNFVVAGDTSLNGNIIESKEDLASVPDEGRVIESFNT